MSDLNANPNTPGTETAVLMGGREARIMAQTAALEEEPKRGLMRKAWVTAGAGALALLAWAGFVEIDEVAMTSGQVIPAGATETVRHPDGGKVSEILVSDGETVEKGQVLIRFHAGDARAELEKMETRHTEIGLMAAEFKALSSGKEPDFSFVSPVYKPLVDKERLIFASLRKLTDNRRSVLSGRVGKTHEKLDNIAVQEETLAEKAALLEEELILRKDLFKKGLTSKDLYLKAKKNVDQVHKDIADLAVSKKQTEKALEEAQKQSVALETRLKERALDDLAVLTGQLDGINETVETLKDRMGRLDIIAPVKGIVRGAQKNPLGEIVEPGAAVIEILPLTGKTTIEARIAVEDFDKVKIGQQVAVTMRDPGYAPYGALSGALKEVSQSTFSDSKGNPYYRGIVAVDRDSVGQGPEQKRLIPGMTVRVRIKTGSKSLIRKFWN